MTVRAPIGPGQSLLVQETYDPAWHAWSKGQRLPVRKDIMGFMLVDAPPGTDTVELLFSTPLENKVGRVLTVLSLAAVFAMLWQGKHTKVVV